MRSKKNNDSGSFADRIRYLRAVMNLGGTSVAKSTTELMGIDSSRAKRWRKSALDGSLPRYAQQLELNQLFQLFARRMSPSEIHLRRGERMDFLLWAHERWGRDKPTANKDWDNAPLSNAADEYQQVCVQFREWARIEADAARRRRETKLNTPRRPRRWEHGVENKNDRNS